jgi:hypothetical protein
VMYLVLPSANRTFPSGLTTGHNTLWISLTKESSAHIGVEQEVEQDHYGKNHAEHNAHCGK